MILAEILVFALFSMNAIGEVYKKTTKQLDLEKRRNKLAEFLSKETAMLEVCQSISLFFVPHATSTSCPEAAY